MARRARLDNGQGSRDSRKRINRETLMPAAFDDIEIGQVVNLGSRAVDEKALAAFVAALVAAALASRNNCTQQHTRTSKVDCVPEHRS